LTSEVGLPAKVDVLGVNVSVTQMNEAVNAVLDAAESERPLSVSALAVHGVMTGVQDPEQLQRLNGIDLVLPDGQPVRWVMNWLHSTRLRERVYGPDLMRNLCRSAERRSLSVYLFGSTEATLAALRRNLIETHPALRIAGSRASEFRRGSDAEFEEVCGVIRESGADMVFVGLGCPRQEIFAYESRNLVRRPVIAVGAAFDFLAGLDSEPSPFVQRVGLQWFHRLIRNPRRLAHRYLVLGPQFLGLSFLQRLGYRPRANTNRGLEPPRLNYL
jgi:N-acetylglucosaminyldiphosphoundecaprenol N-acetyl-beta-D-mannosaminyltransferase